MTHHERKLFRETLNMLRCEVASSDLFAEQPQKVADDYIVSTLHLSKRDIAEIYRDVPDTAISDTEAVHGPYAVNLTLEELRKYMKFFEATGAKLLCNNFFAATDPGPEVRPIFCNGIIGKAIFTVADIPDLGKYAGAFLRLEEGRAYPDAEILLVRDADGKVICTV